MEIIKQIFKCIINLLDTHKSKLFFFYYIRKISFMGKIRTICIYNAKMIYFLKI